MDGNLLIALDRLELFQLATAAQLAGTLALAVFFVIMARNDPRPWLRDWTGAWVAQGLALILMLGSAVLGHSASLFLFLLLETAHGLLLCFAAIAYHGDPVPWRMKI